MNRSNQKGEIERLEKSFWQSMLDGAPEVATRMLTEPAVMVSAHGTNKFDHAAYLKMANDDKFKLTDYEISGMDVIFPTDDVAVASYHVNQKMQMNGKPLEMEVYDTSTWVKVDDRWLCVMHTESPVASKH
ncbi:MULTISPECIES: nuclear transport factor 2 family protein [unclassified Lysobacter]|uniref:nuclear transport factor 2 family protein n=1 Tax=unclassified Lysobacter TaxID=2635362 RepID=UPI001BE6A70A|nr:MULTISPECIES: nuclear transport factor 2 family protein [unclassified Lysobacter]MBT2747678.1 nuclear transport factor 2 family protein [Lysobacter sp. ISL-42]MBT2752841.1 nuclear transport factor 2 family protein [Lysobacter sp. ISL-50]MBT2779725.1 nuclear transport factor 2 family protein [Lysobacter sp. ISL-54]MBT2780096.1 nuclear transport factor 2 family protein [Lysobacter sp. ISL-52]